MYLLKTEVTFLMNISSVWACGEYRPRQCAEKSQSRATELLQPSGPLVEYNAKCDETVWQVSLDMAYNILSLIGLYMCKLLLSIFFCYTIILQLLGKRAEVYSYFMATWENSQTIARGNEEDLGKYCQSQSHRSIDIMWQHTLSQ